MTPLRCAILDDYQSVALRIADWSPLGRVVDVRSVPVHLPDENEIVAAVGDCQILVVMRERTPFTASLFARLGELQLLVTSGMRNAAIDLEAAAAHDVTVCGTVSSSEPPAELTWALILCLARQVIPESTALANGGPWQSTVGVDLNGSRLGLLGLGKIGARMARIGAAFGMDVVAWSQNLTAERADEVGALRAQSKEQVLETADFVSIHLALSDRTRGLVGRPELRRMRPTAYLVNTSRAAIVDTDALVNALREGHIAGAGLDVFDVEPLPAAHPLRSLPNVVATPHLGYVTQANYRRYYAEAVEDIRAFLAGTPIRPLA